MYGIKSLRQNERGIQIQQGSNMSASGDISSGKSPATGVASGGSSKNVEYKHGFEEWGCTRPELTYLSTGAPGEDTLQLCTDIMERATAHRMSKERERGHLFQYGPMQGDWEFRCNLADFLQKHYNDEVKREHLFGTCGATHGLHLLATLLFPPGATIFVEEPTYFIAITILRDDLGYNLVPVPKDEDGILPEELSRLLNEYNHTSQHVPTGRRPFWSMLYTVPTYSNPTGRTMTPERMVALVELARQHDILIFTDDVYNLLHYDTDAPYPPKRLFAYDDQSDANYRGNVVSSGSFSKILAPGLRLGWLEAPERIVDALLDSYVMRSGGSCNHYLCGIMGSALSLQLQTKHLDQLKEKYRRHMEIVQKILSEQLPEGVTFTKPKGGYFIWIQLPSGYDAGKLKQLCVDKYRVTFADGSAFSMRGKYKECFRIAISHYPTEVLRDAATRLCQAVREFVEQQ